MKARRNTKILSKVLFSTLVMMIVFNICEILGDFVRTFIIGKCLGATAMAAHGASSSFCCFAVLLGTVLATGINIYVAGLLQRGNIEKANQTIDTAIIACLTLTALTVVVVFIFASAVADITTLGEANGEMKEMMEEYIRGYSLGMPAFGCHLILSAIAILAGKSKYVSVAAIILLVTNVCGCILAVFSFNGSLFLIALSTSIAYYVSLLVYTPVIFSNNSSIRIRLKTFRFKALLKVINCGMPTAIKFLCKVASPILINSYILSVVSIAGGAAIGVQANVRDVLSCVPFSMETALLMLLSMSYAEQYRNEIIRLMIVTMRIILPYTVVLSVLVFCFAHDIASFYLTASDYVIDLCADALRATAVMLPLFSFNRIIAVCFQASRHINLANLHMFGQRLIVLVPCIYVMGETMGAVGIFWAFPMCELLIIVISLLYLVKTGDKRTGVIDRLLLMGRGFGIPKKNSVEYSISNFEELSLMSEEVQRFCEKHEETRHLGVSAALCTYEMAENVVKHSFKNSKVKSCDVRVFISDGRLVIRIQDTGQNFDIIKHAENLNDTDITHNIGTRMIMNLTDDIRYTSALGMNTVYMYCNPLKKVQ